MTLRYIADPFRPTRRPTRVVRVGDVGVGGDNPLRIQSMTTTDTQDTRATADQAERLADAGCEIVRITAPSARDAENLGEIAAELRRRGVRVPLVADIHFVPNAAMIAAEHVEKIRVNPGNYADKKRFEVREYSDAQYAEEVERVAERFRPLVRRCRELGRALRIGTNHGSLSDRILNRFGDTPRGMVESALEFLDVCEDEGYREIVFSMKASNTQVAIHAYRLLAQRLEERAPGEPSYPFHLGVTEAGDAEDGRIKSAIGIGALLEDGIGDTIRVSLTEDPVREVPVARALARRCEARWAEDAAAGGAGVSLPFPGDPFEHARRATRPFETGPLTIGADAPVRVELDLGRPPVEVDALAARLSTGFALLGDLDCESLAVEVVDSDDLARWEKLRSALEGLASRRPWTIRCRASLAPEALSGSVRPDRIGIEVGEGETPDACSTAVEAAREADVPVEWALEGSPARVADAVRQILERAAGSDWPVDLFSLRSSRTLHAARALVASANEAGRSDCPVLLRDRAGGAANAGESGEGDDDAGLIAAAIDLGAPLCDGIGDAVSLAPAAGDPTRAVDLAYRILQGARLRTTRTEYISCPSCGRTLFDLEETTAKIKTRTEHLKGVKIAVMGCIVNGPGEMADADFGYVGSGPGVVSLYVGKEVVERKVPEDDAPDRLVELIRSHGRWQDPS